MSRARRVLACLAFAVPFGGVGALATWAIGATLWEAHRAKDWVQVPAMVEEAALHESDDGEGGATYRAEGRFRYAFKDGRYTGSRLGISRLGGSDNIDDWHESVSATLEAARAAGRPIMVWVNPGNPYESVFNRELRWKELLFLLVFSLAFGGVGVGMLVAMVAVLRGPKTPSANPGAGRPAPSRTDTMAAQAQRAMFDPPQASSFLPGAGHSGLRDTEIPSSSVDVHEQGGTLTLRYSARRRRALAIVLLIAGSVITLGGAALLFAEEGFVAAVVMIVIGSALDAAAIAFVLSSLVVTVRSGEFAVERKGLLGNRSWRVRRESIRALKPVPSYSINDRPYYSLYAETDDGRVPIGNSLEGADVAEALAYRIAQALGLPPSIVSPVAASNAKTDPE